MKKSRQTKGKAQYWAQQCVWHSTAWAEDIQRKQPHAHQTLMPQSLPKHCHLRTHCTAWTKAICRNNLLIKCEEDWWNVKNIAFKCLSFISIQFNCQCTSGYRSNIFDLLMYTMYNISSVVELLRYGLHLACIVQFTLYTLV